MPAPLIEFSQFAHPHRWWLQRGEPPWLHDDRWWVRAFRVSLILGVMGTVSGWLSAGLEEVLRDFPNVMGTRASEFAMVIAPGVCYGLVTLLPLSRWLGRGWIFSLLAIPVSVGACICGIAAFLLVSPIMSPSPDWIPGGQKAAGFYAGFVGAALMALWMGHPLRRSAWLAFLAAATIGCVSAGCFLLIIDELESSLYVLPAPVRNFVALGLLAVSFQSVTTVGLGIRLWWPSERADDQTRSPAANTPATSAANPASNTESAC